MWRPRTFKLINSPIQLILYPFFSRYPNEYLIRCGKCYSNFQLLSFPHLWHGRAEFKFSSKRLFFLPHPICSLISELFFTIFLSFSFPRHFLLLVSSLSPCIYMTWHSFWSPCLEVLRRVRGERDSGGDENSNVCIKFIYQQDNCILGYQGFISSEGKNYLNLYFECDNWLSSANKPR